MLNFRYFKLQKLILEYEDIVSKYQKLVEQYEKELDTGRDMILNLKKENASLKAQIDELRSVENET